MNIILITTENFAQHRDDLIQLGDEFLVDVCEQDPRSEADSEEVYRAMLAAAPTTEILLAKDEEGSAIGTSYYNYGTGYSCGGTYLWLNGIYIREANQKNGYGSRLLEYMIEGGRRKHDIKLFICCRAPENEGSRRLFAKAGFSQHPNTGMEKTWA